MTLENSFNFYTGFRLVLLGVTVYSGVDQVRTLLRYKAYYDKVPEFLKQPWLAKSMVKQGKPLLVQTLKKHQRDFAINGILFGILVCLNIVAFIY
ncbi:MAG: hypothetical protein AAGA67_13635 [Cyanobacteria bacterium P01_F01_bin.153]